ncbi:MAG: penicillin-binding protein 2 [Candidatus Aminicenantes bacterium]|jgi:cell division protein FtsI (penicillin-binding protein 3)
MKNPQEKRINTRTFILLFFLFLWLGVVVMRLVELQVVNHKKFKSEVLKQNHDVEAIIPQRGTIFDRSGTILARSLPRPSIFYYPPKDESLESHRRKINKLRRILGLSPSSLDSIYSRIKKGKSFIWIKREVEPELADRVKELNLTGIHFDNENKRFYPHGKRAAQLIGRVNIDDRGQSGIEYRYNTILEGEKGKRLILKDAKHREYRFEILKEPEPGKDLILTIDETIQYITEKELAKALRETQALWGTVIISHPSTGEILAMASLPTFDLNAPPPSASRVDRNRAIHHTFDPGSTFKIVTASAALENNCVRLRDVFDCTPGKIQVPGKTVWDHKKMGILTFPDVIIHSSNVGTIQIGERIGEDNLYAMIKAYGFGERSGIDLPAEERGIFRPVKNWTGISLYSLSIGYEISVTAVQMLQAISAVANNGIVTSPRVVKRIQMSSGEQQDTALEFRRVISENTAQTLSRILENAVLRGTGTKARIDGYRAAGKTGTAQKFDPSIGRYSNKIHTASFAGFVPVENPVLAIVVVVDEPKGLFYGGDVAAPVFQAIASQTLRYLQLPKDEPLPKTIMTARARSAEGR